MRRFDQNLGEKRVLLGSLSKKILKRELLFPQVSLTEDNFWADKANCVNCKNKMVKDKT
jgi:hypothetical protein